MKAKLRVFMPIVLAVMFLLAGFAIKNLPISEAETTIEPEVSLSYQEDGTYKLANMTDQMEYNTNSEYFVGTWSKYDNRSFDTDQNFFIRYSGTTGPVKVLAARKNYAVTLTWTGATSKSISLKTDKGTYIDWGDGNVEYIPVKSTIEAITHSYETTGNYTVKIADNVVKYLDCNDSLVSVLDLTYNTKLTELHCSNNNITSLNLSKNTVLTDLYVNNNKLSRLDLVNNSVLTHVSCVQDGLNPVVILKSQFEGYVEDKDAGVDSITGVKKLYKHEDTTASYSTLIIPSTPTVTPIKNDDGTYRLDGYTEKMESNTIDPTYGGTWTTYTENNLQNIDFNQTYYIREAAVAGTSIASLAQTVNVEVIKALDNGNGTSRIEGMKVGFEYSTLTNPTWVAYTEGVLNQITVSDTYYIRKATDTENVITVPVTVLPAAVMTATEEETAAISFTWNTTGQKDKHIEIRTNGATTIDWGDGSEVYTITGEIWKTIEHPYENEGTYTVTIKDNVVTYLSINRYTGSYYENNQVSMLNVKNATILQTLYCNNNNLTELDLSNNSALVLVECHVNEIEELNVSNSPELTRFLCYENKLTKLDVTNNKKLNYLHCMRNAITELDVTQNTVLDKLRVDLNKLTELDVTQNTELTYLDVEYNLLTALDISNNLKLELLKADGCLLNDLDISKNTALTLVCADNPSMKYLYLTEEQSMKFWSRAYINDETTLIVVDSTEVVYNISYEGIEGATVRNPNIYTVKTDTFTLNKPIKEGYKFLGWTGSNGDTPETTVTIEQGSTGDRTYTAVWEVDDFPAAITFVWDASGSKEKNIIIRTNGETTLDWGDGSEIVTISANASEASFSHTYDSGNYIVTIADDVVTSLTCSSNNISAIYLSNNKELQSLTCDNNSLRELNIDNNESLTYLNCESNGLRNLNISNNKELVYVDCSNNQITQLDTSNNEVLEYLDCSENGADLHYLPSLDLSNNERLTYLDCSGNKISNLNLSNNKDLLYLNCANNNHDGQAMTRLDISNNIALVELDCSNNKIVELDISKNINIDSANLSNSTMTTLYLTEAQVAMIGTDISIYENTTLNIVDKAETLYTIMFNANDGTGNKSTQIFAQNQAQNLTANTYAREGYRFLGWSTTEDGTVEYEDKVSYTATSNTILYAVWEEILCGDANDDGEVDLFDALAIKEYLANWTAIVLENSDVNLDGEINMYDVHIIKAYDVGDISELPYNGKVITYYLTPEDDGTVQLFETGETKALITPEFSKDGYELIGWSTTYGGEVAYEVGANYTANSDLTLYPVWEIVTYTITYDLNGGSAINPTRYTAETETFTLINPTKEGYKFTGWTGTGLDGLTTEVTIDKGSTENRTYTANWEALTGIKYTVKHWQQNIGSDIEENSANYTLKDTEELNGALGASVTPSVKEYEGFTSPDTKTVTINSDGSTEVNYYYTRNRYTLSININFNSNITLKQYGESIEKPEDPQIEGYTFEGWDEEIPDTMPAENLKITAIFTVNKYTITYDLVGGTVSSENPTEYTVESGDISLISPTKPGYTFLGWTGEGLQGVPGSMMLPKGSTGNKSFTANWTINTYTITYDLDGGSVSSENPTKYTIESEDIKLINPTKEGYTFAGWTGTGLDIATIDVTISKGSTGSRVLTATWLDTSKEIYTINYDLAGGIVYYTNPSAYTSEEIITLNNPIKAGYIFLGWTGSNGETPELTVTVEKGSTGNKSYTANWEVATGIKYTVKHLQENIGIRPQQIGPGPDDHEINYTLKEAEVFYGTTGASVTPSVKDYEGFRAPSAKTVTISEDGSTEVNYYYIRKIYTITFNTNEGSEVESIYGQYETNIGEVDTPTKEGYTFGGWTPEIPRKIPAENITLTANWIINNYTITYNLNGGNASNSESYTVETETFTLNNPTRNGYTFVGWTGTDLDGPKMTVTIAKGSIGDKSYTATWTEDVSDPAITFVWNTKEDLTKKIKITATAETTVNWGDGESSLVSVGENNLTHEYDATVGESCTVTIEDNVVTHLECGENEITTLDVSRATALIKLYCDSNLLTELDVSNNIVLEKLNCLDNQLTALNVTNNTALKELNCYYNKITELDVSKNTALTDLSCGTNQLGALDVSNNTELEYLGCDDNKLTTLDVSKNTKLKNLGCGNNQLTILNVENNVVLEYLTCWGNKLTTLDVSNNTSLEMLLCSDNQLTILDVSKNTALTELICSDNKLTGLNVEKNIELTKLECGRNPITTLDISKNTALELLFADNMGLTQLDVSKNTALTVLHCSSNQLTRLDVSNNTKLEHFGCANNQLSELNVSKNTALLSLSCGNNPIGSIDVSKNTLLGGLNCSNNQLSTLNVEANTLLTSLDCSNNQLTTLNVSKNTGLDLLRCWSNQLSTLDVSKNTALTGLYCQDNLLTTLDISNNTDLEQLRCNNNQLTELNIINNKKLNRANLIQESMKKLELTQEQQAMLEVTVEAPERWAENTIYVHPVTNSEAAITFVWNTKEDLTKKIKITATAETTLYWGDGESSLISVGENNLTHTYEASIGESCIVIIKDNVVTQLECSNSQITNLDLSKATILTSLICGDNNLTLLDLSKNTELTRLDCRNNQIEELDITNNTKITAANLVQESLKSLLSTEDQDKMTKQSNTSEVELTEGNIYVHPNTNWSDLTIYTITYEGLDGATVTQNPQTYTERSETFTLNNPTKEGYTFAGWTGTDLTEATISVTIAKGSSGDRSYTATWERDTSAIYTINYELNGGEVTTANPTTYSTVTESFTLVNPTREGYTFKGWSGDGEGLSVTIAKGSTGNKTFTANWEINTYTITYDLAGGTVSKENPTTYTIEDAITLNNPTRTGYAFTGWKEEGVEGVKETATIAKGSIGNKKFTATWSTGIAYAITYNLNGGSATNPESYTVEESFTLVNPTREGYTFKGWSGDGEGLSVTIVKGSTGNKTFTANWEVITYTITYDLADGVLGTENPVTYTVEDAITLTNPTRSGYTFAGWKEEGVEGVKETATIAKGNTGNKKFTATWTLVNYVITYELDGGTVKGNPVSYTVETESFTLVNPTREGYTFKGWSGDGEDLSVTIAKGSTGNKTFTANWEVVNYTISYELAEGVLGTENPATYTVEDSFTLNNPTRSGYTFTGWKEEGVDEVRETVTIAKGSTGNKKYTATWALVNYVITYELDGGTVEGNPESYTVETESFTLVSPTRSGYTFAGWIEDGVDEVRETVVIEQGSMGDKYFTATWKLISYTITYELDGGIAEGNPVSYTIEDSFTLEYPTKEGYRFEGWLIKDSNSIILDLEIEEGTIGDKIFTALWVSIEHLDAITFTWDTTEQLDKWITISTNGETIIDWGDGTEKTIVSSELDSEKITHNYATTGIYTVRIIDDVVTKLDVTRAVEKSAAVSKLVESESLAVASIDSNTPVLSTDTNSNLTYENNQLLELDVSNSTELKELNCSYNNLDELDLSRNTSLKTLICSDNNLTELDLTKNEELENLCCHNNNLVELDISQNQEITQVCAVQDTLEKVVLNEEQKSKFTVVPDSSDCTDVTQNTICLSPNTEVKLNAFKIVIKAEENGKVSPSGVIKAKEGSWKQIKITPNSGYRVEDVLVNGKSVGAVEIYFLENISRNYVIEVKFEKIPRTSGGNGNSYGGSSSSVSNLISQGIINSSWRNKFTDVSKNDWFYSVVEFANERKYFAGITETTFAPNDPMTREMFVAVLYNMANKPITYGENNYHDVPYGHWSEAAIVWANTKGLVSGYPDGNFMPGKPITRQEVATILKKYAEHENKYSLERDDLAGFNDTIDVQWWAKDSIGWAVAKGVMKGDTYKCILPQKSATRAEVAAMIMNYCKMD